MDTKTNKLICESSHSQLMFHVLFILYYGNQFPFSLSPTHTSISCFLCISILFTAVTNSKHLFKLSSIRKTMPVTVKFNYSFCNQMILIPKSTNLYRFVIRKTIQPIYKITQGVSIFPYVNNNSHPRPQKDIIFLQT